MRYDTYGLNRRSIRRAGYDYATAGAYFITICAHDRESIFGDVVRGQMRLDECGAIVRQCWHDLPSHYGNVVLDAFVVMPNHVHGVIVLTDDHVGAGFKPALLPFPAPSRTAAPAGPGPNVAAPGAQPRHHALPEIVRGLKTFSSRRINALRDTQGARVWQRNFYEHIVRDEDDLSRIQAYIEDNPRRWPDDEYNPARPP